MGGFIRAVPTRLAVALAAVGLIGAAGGAVAIATGGGSGDVIHACKGKLTGNLRAVSSPDKCRRSERPLSWNKQGPQGPQGETGPGGPSNAFTKTESQQRVANANVELVALELPPGAYTVTASMFAFNASDTGRRLACRVSGGTAPPTGYEQIVPLSGTADAETFSFTTALTVPSTDPTTTVSLDCVLLNSPGDDVIVSNPNLTAIQVETLDVQ